MLKLLQLLVNGLEHSFANRGLGGMASAFQVSSSSYVWYLVEASYLVIIFEYMIQVLEIAHTHYWTKDLNDMAGEHGQYSQFLDPNTLSPGLSMAGSPISSTQASPDASRRPSSQSAEPGKFSNL